MGAVVNRFGGKTVIVTGGALGFGEAISRTFAAEGANVVVADLNYAGAQAVASSLPSAIAVEIDVSDAEHTEAMAAVAMSAYGRIDVLCANAGIPHRSCALIDLALEDFDRMFAVNVRSIYLGAKYCVPHMQEGSSIISTASIGGIRPRPRMTAYNASKGAVLTLTRGLAVELAPKIRVNAVCPVSAATGFDAIASGMETMPENVEQSVVRGIPMGRRCTPQDVANAIVFLASDEASFLTGVCLDVDGGRSIQ